MSDVKIVISGISGIYPKCNNISQLAEKLFAKEDLITDIPDINFSAGKLNSVSKFDSTFFGATNEHAEYMDPMCRILLEKTFEAILDAGYNTQELRDSSTAVFIANCTSDAEVESAFGTDVRGALICERAQSFLANRISYCFGLYGPSCTVNTACSSSLYALEFACKAIKSNQCEAAIVGGSNLSLAPGMIQLYKNLGITSARCRSFDDAANGFCRSEAISVIFVQKAEYARRIYAEVVHVKTNNDGYKKQSILFPSHQMQAKLINEVYEECGLPKSQLAWVEAHGTGTRVGDYQEMKSLETLCENRDSPLLVGCIKSSLGHTEATSGLCSIAKVIIAMETGRIPPNLHFSTPQSGIETLLKGEMKIITEETSWDGGYVAVNNFGIGGANAHLLLKSNTQKNNDLKIKDNLPKLVTISGRTLIAVNTFIFHLKTTPINTEFIALLHCIFSGEISKHDFRGYIILDEPHESIAEQVQKVKSTKRPIWFVYPGMGSQWPGMAKQLLHLSVFKKSVLRSHKILEKYGIDLKEVLTNEETVTLQNILNCFVGITAVMIALTDLLTSVGIECDGVIGHSFGEILCGYADECLTQEQALLAAYYRGAVSLEKNTTCAKMLVIGLDGPTVQKKCPESVEIACYNGSNSCTVAGPTEDIAALADALKRENIFIANVYSANIAYHSSYIRELGPAYCEYLKTVIPNPKRISSKWVPTSTSDSRIKKYCSPEFFANNFTSPVQFENALAHIPNDAVTIEVAPHCILKSVLNSNLNTTITNNSLLDKNAPNILHNLLKSLGRLYNEGVTMDLGKLYPPISFPVSRGTPMISPLIKWNHEKNWHVPFQDFDPVAPFLSRNFNFEVTYENVEYEYLRDCIIDHKNLFPESALLKMVWDRVAEREKSPPKNITSVMFKNLHFHERIEMLSKGSINFDVMVARGSGIFEVVLGEKVIAEGCVEITDDEKVGNFLQVRTDPETLILKAEDIYKELRIKGYNYGNKFRTLSKSNKEGTEAIVRWDGSWVTYLDGLFQFLYFNVSDICAVTSIDRLHIQIPPSDHTHERETAVSLCTNPPEIRSDFIAIAGVKLKRIERQFHPEPIFQSMNFTPYFDYKNLMVSTKVIEAILTIILENNLNSRINVHELDVWDVHSALSHKILHYFQIRSFYKADITVHMSDETSASVPSADQFPGINFTNEFFHFPNTGNIHLIIAPHSTDNLEILVRSLNSLTESGFILSREEKDQTVFNKVHGLEISAVYHTEEEELVLWHKVLRCEYISCVNISDSFDWIKTLQSVLMGRDSSHNKVILYSNCKCSGIIGFFNCIRKENTGHNMRCFLILDSDAPQFSLDNKLYSDQLKLDLTMNVYKNNMWGCYVPYKLEYGQTVSVRKAALRLKEVSDEEANLTWVQCGDNEEQNIRGADTIYVHYATYPKSVLAKEGDNEDDSFFIFSGIDEHQEEIVGVAFNGFISNVVSKNDSVHWILPKSWTLEIAPLSIFPYLAAAITLTDRALTVGGTLVVQDASSFFGTALLVTALTLKYVVYTVERNTQRSRQIKENFPQVKGSFSAGSLPINYEGGATVLVTSKIEYDSYEIIKFFGCKKIICLEIKAKTDVTIIETALRNGVLLKIVNLIDISGRRVRKATDIVEMVTRSNSFVPLSINFTKINVSPGQRIQPPMNQTLLYEIKTEQSSSHLIDAEPKLSCSKNCCYVICGGLGGMGFELAGWLIERGVRKLVLVSRTGFCDGYRTRKIDTWRRSGVIIQISIDDIGSMEGVQNLLTEANKLGTVDAIFNTTLMLQDNLFENQTSDSFQAVAGSKAIATILMDQASRRMCPYLRHFVVFSSIACGYGNAGQSNYGYANSVMERICELRREEGLPGLAIEWAGVGDVGYMENKEFKFIGTPVGTLLQPIKSCLSALDLFLSQNTSIVTSFVVADGKNQEYRTIDSIFTTIRKIIDKSDLKPETETTLGDIGLDSIAATETKNILEQQFNIFMDAKEVLNLRLCDLRRIESGQTLHHRGKKFFAQKLAVLEAFYSNLFGVMLKMSDPLHLKPIIRLPSFLHNGAVNEIPIAQEKTIFFLPSIEGFASIMQPLARNMDIQVLCAQYSLGETSIKEIANRILQEIESRLTTSKPFHLLGYSYGGLLAMEIARALENKGKSGFVYLIDSSPRIVKRIAKVLFGDENFRINNLAFVRALNCKVNSKEFEDIMLQQNSWPDLKNVTMNFIPDFVPHKKEHLGLILDTLKARNEDIEHYEGIRAKNSNNGICFFKPKDTLFDIHSSSHDLEEYCCAPVQEFEVEGNHFSMLKSERLAYHMRTLHKNTE